MSDLYFMRVMPDGPVKIGHARDVWKRQQNIQCNSPFEIDCIARLPGRGYEEVAWHAAFADDAIRGEWFAWSYALEEAIMHARHNEAWWQHLVPCAAFVEDQAPTSPTEIAEATIDWHVMLQIFCAQGAESAGQPRALPEIARLQEEDA